MIESMQGGIQMRQGDLSFSSALAHPTGNQHTPAARRTAAPGAGAQADLAAHPPRSPTGPAGPCLPPARPARQR
eukprot:346254-Pelagomonas_calceolata.AAC.12